MKRIVFLCILMLTALFVAQPMQAQVLHIPTVTGTSMQDIYTAGAVFVVYLESERNEIVHIQYDIVQKGITASIFRTLTNHWAYTVLGFADTRVKDLDITVYKLVGTDWIQVGNDQKVDKLPLVLVAPTETATYRFDISGYEFNGSYETGHYGLFIYHVEPGTATTPATDQSTSH